MAKIYLYCADANAARKLGSALSRDGFDAQCREPDGAFPAREEAALVVLDARLKWTACRPLIGEFHARNWPVLFLTADHQMPSHLRALYPGQCDVLMLPFSHKQLIDKVEGLLGRSEPLRALTVDEQERVALLDGERVELTAQELALLLALMEEPDTPVSREQLLRRAWGYQSMGETRTVDVHVQRLRKKLGGERIETVYKCGYRLKMA